MVTASQLRIGMAIKFEGQIYKVVAAEYHGGQGKMGAGMKLSVEFLEGRPVSVLLRARPAPQDH